MSDTELYWISLDGEGCFCEKDVMGRPHRIIAPGLPHHLWQRGNRSLDIFANDADRLIYLSLIKKSAKRYGVDICAYCLMTNHVHFVVVPEAKESISLLIRDAHSAYAAVYNRRQGLAGHLWRGRFGLSVMDEPYMWAAVRYIERNPIRAAIVAAAETYHWSSAAAHCGLRGDALVASQFPIGGVVSDWRAWLADEDVDRSNAIRQPGA